MQKWLYGGKEIESVSQFPEGCVGFVYMITNTTNGKIYVGKKTLFNTLTKKLTKKESSAWDKPGRVPKKKKEVKESDWKQYYGSCKPLLEDVISIGPEKFKREILVMCTNKKALSYFEVYHQIKHEVLHTEAYNENIMGKYFRKDITCVID